MAIWLIPNGHYNVDKQFAFRRNGDFYEVEPYALIWQNDFYYLIGRFVPENTIRHYRIDRMRSIEVTENKFRRASIDLKAYVDKTFNMFSGEDMLVKIEFDIGLLNAVYDRFGMEADIRHAEEDRILLTTKAKVSAGLIGWILTWGSKAKIVAPRELVDMVRDEARRLADLYTQ
ncbi:hypothetical protein BTO30_10600 [Domibacillus antri]|uniref:Uncharacterized protein n=1 Tax=Domibacillus antri TaxID=1714264 RepID=A0A1Q8Q4I8_9BACI|nr:WYL domain-containing protein [Domibacillus antri]OLN22191.1 hypothetical protein BTO30_10600 [Domibacillus antri]